MGQWIKSQMGTDQVKGADGYTYSLYVQAAQGLRKISVHIKAAALAGKHFQ